MFFELMLMFVLGAFQRNSGDSALIHYDIPRPVRTSSPASDPGLIAHTGRRNASPTRSTLSADQSYDTSWNDEVELGGLVGGGSNRALVAELRFVLNQGPEFHKIFCKLTSSMIYLSLL